MLSLYEVEPSGFIVTKLGSLFNDHPHFLSVYSYLILVYGSYPFECNTLLYFASICYIMYILSNVHLTDQHFFYQKECGRRAQTTAKHGILGGKIL